MQRILAIVAAAALAACGTGSRPGPGGNTGGNTGGGDTGGNTGGGDTGGNNGGGDNGGGTVVDTTAPETLIAPPGGLYESAITVTLTANEPATLTWTLDGTDPLESSTVQTAASPATLSVEGSFTLKVFATDTAGNKEAVRTEAYTILSSLTPAIIAGTVHVAERLRNESLYVSAFVQGSQGPIEAKKVVLGMTQAAEAPFVIEALGSGSFYVIAGVDVGADGSAANDIMAASPAGPFELDPAVEGKKQATGAEIWLGLADPERGSIEGNIMLGEQYRTLRPYLFVFDRQPAEGVEPVAVTLAEPANAEGRTSYIATVDNTAGYHVYAALDPAGDGLGTDDDIWTAHPTNPVAVMVEDPEKRHATGIDFWIGMQNPELAHLSGTLALSAPLPTGTAFVALLDAPVGQHRRIVGYQPVDISAGGTTFAYEMLNVPFGTWYPVAVVENAAGKQALGVRQAAVVLSTTAPSAGAVDFTVGVGLVKGRITVIDETAAYGEVLVLLVPAGTSRAVAGEWFPLGLPDSTGRRTGNYELFGAPEGTFDMYAILDKNNDQDYVDDMNAGNITAGPDVTVSGGVAANDSDFTF
jgi:hypothetical protein